MLDFHERLGIKKEQIAGSKPEDIPDPIITQWDIWRIEAGEILGNMFKLLSTVVVGAAIFSLVMCSLIIRDWWTYIGSPEYHEWKQRVERGK